MSFYKYFVSCGNVIVFPPRYSPTPHHTAGPSSIGNDEYHLLLILFHSCVYV